ncbi:MAG: helix-turn-helix domain-containing protein [Putridiphycobacter sp.]|nr:helix-turn-helix domain-containing protein [Putridiphycobacter sp.]
MNNSLSIAVLPFKNMSSNDENEYFCDGITEEIINALSKIASLKVTSRTSSFHFKKKELPISTIANTLGVSIILEGSARLAGNIIRITAQLIQAEDDFHFWSETWDRELKNIFEIQDEISLLIAEKIREQFGHFELADHLYTKGTDNINAYEYALMARFHKNKWNPDDIVLAETFYKKALALDSNHVDALIGLADVYSFRVMTGLMPFIEGWEQSNKLVAQTLALDPNNPEAYYQKANSSFFTESNFGEALAHAKKSIQLKPNYVESQQFLSFLYILNGDREKAKEHLDIALGIDPLSQETLFFSAYFDYMTDNYAAALKQLDSCLEVNPKNIPAHAVKCLSLIKLERYETVLAYLENNHVILPEGEKVGAIALSYAGLKDQENLIVQKRILQAMADEPDGFAADSFLFLLHAFMGEMDKAFAWVEKGIKTKSTLLMLRYVDPVAANLRTDKRFKAFHDIIFSIGKYKVSNPKKKKALLNESATLAFKHKLLEHLSEASPYLDPNLSLRSLADQIGIHPNQLSWLLNEHIGKSFNEFINAYRIQKFKALAKDPKNAHLTLIGLAYDSGFNSKTVFNTYFKRETGLTPKQFLKSQSS